MAFFPEDPGFISFLRTWLPFVGGHTSNVAECLSRESYRNKSGGVFVVLSFLDGGLISIKFSGERTLERMVVIFGPTGQ